MDLTKIPLPGSRATLILGSQYGVCDFVPIPGKLVIVSVSDNECPCELKTTKKQLVVKLPWTIKGEFIEKFSETRHLVYTVIDHALRLGVPVLVHCKRGHRRSVIIVTSYLMHKYGWSPEKAIAHVKKVRPSIKEQHVLPVIQKY